MYSDYSVKLLNRPPMGNEIVAVVNIYGVENAEMAAIEAKLIFKNPENWKCLSVTKMGE